VVPLSPSMKTVGFIRFLAVDAGIFEQRL